MLSLKKFTTRDALRTAASQGCLEAVRFFVEEGVDKDEADENGRTPLMLATKKKRLAVVQFLEEYKTEKKTANARDALRAAANRGCLEAVKFLVGAGVSREDTDKKGRTALLLAVQAGHVGVARYLAESMQEERTDDTENSWGSAALRFAAKKGQLEVLQWLSEQGVDKESADQDGTTALIYAAKNGHLAVSQWLLEQGADVNKATKSGYTPLHYAALYGCIEVVPCLMNWGAFLTAKVESGYLAGQPPIGVTDDEAIKQLIRDEETRRRDHGYKRAVIPNPTEAERQRARLDRGEDEEETEGQGQAVASAVEEEENDDSGSDVEY